MRGTRVVTETTCTKCGMLQREDGAHGGMPPPGWSHITVTQRHEGSGWTNNTSHIDGHYCPDCTKGVVEQAQGGTRSKTTPAEQMEELSARVRSTPEYAEAVAELEREERENNEDGCLAQPGALACEHTAALPKEANDG